MRSFVRSLLIATVACAGTAAAHAATTTFTFSATGSDGLSVSGTLTGYAYGTTGEYFLTGGSGTLTSTPTGATTFTLEVDPNSPPAVYTANAQTIDNLLFTGAGEANNLPVDGNGIALLTAADSLAFNFYDGGGSLDFVINNIGAPSSAPPNYTGTISSFAGAAATPEPSSLALLGTAILGGAGVVRRRIVRS